LNTSSPNIKMVMKSVEKDVKKISVIIGAGILMLNPVLDKYLIPGENSSILLYKFLVL